MTNTTFRTRWRVLIPASLSLTVLILIAILASPLHELMGERLKPILTTDLIRQVAGSLSLFAGARLIMLFLRQRLQIRSKGQRPVPKVVLDVLSTVIYTLVAIVSLSLFLRDDLSGLLTGSGLVLAVLALPSATSWQTFSRASRSASRHRSGSPTGFRSTLWGGAVSSRSAGGPRAWSQGTAPTLFCQTARSRGRRSPISAHRAKSIVTRSR